MHIWKTLRTKTERKLKQPMKEISFKETKIRLMLISHQKQKPEGSWKNVSADLELYIEWNYSKQWWNNIYRKRQEKSPKGPTKRNTYMCSLVRINVTSNGSLQMQNRVTLKRKRVGKPKWVMVTSCVIKTVYIHSHVYLSTVTWGPHRTMDIWDTSIVCRKHQFILHFGTLRLYVVVG